jgi:hypothetical protein
MTGLDRAELYLFWLTIAGQVLLYLRMRHEGLHRVYRFFAAYLLFRALRAGALAALPPLSRLLAGQSWISPFQTNLYGWVWLATEPVLWIFYILIVLEMYSLVFQNYKGIGSLSRWAVMAGLAIALLLAGLTLPADLSNPDWRFPLLRYAFVANRGVVSGLVVFLLFATGFVVWFPVPLSRNTVVYTIVYTLYFLLLSVSTLARNVEGSAVAQWHNIVLGCSTLACLAAWGLFLDRRGERKTVSVGHKWAPLQEQHLIEQLAAINASLLRTVPK